MNVRAPPRAQNPFVPWSSTKKEIELSPAFPAPDAGALQQKRAMRPGRAPTRLVWRLLRRLPPVFQSFPEETSWWKLNRDLSASKQQGSPNRNYNEGSRFSAAFPLANVKKFST